jgi:hypothetical protein
MHSREIVTLCRGQIVNGFTGAEFLLPTEPGAVTMAPHFKEFRLQLHSDFGKGLDRLGDKIKFGCRNDDLKGSATERPASVFALSHGGLSLLLISSNM